MNSNASRSFSSNLRPPLETRNRPIPTALTHLTAAQPSGCGSPRFQPADEKFQVDGFLRISVGDFFKKFADGDFHAEFLADFADQALLEGFVRFAFAAGKFPQPAEMRIRRGAG